MVIDPCKGCRLWWEASGGEWMFVEVGLYKRINIETTV